MATEHGVSDDDLKRLVEDYVDRAMSSGMLKTDRKYTKPRVNPMTTPKTRTFTSRVVDKKATPLPPQAWQRGYPSYRRLPSGNVEECSMSKSTKEARVGLNDHCCSTETVAERSGSAMSSEETFKKETLAKSVEEMATGDVEESEPLLPKGPEDEKTLTWIDVEATVPLVGKSSKSRRKTVLRSVSGVALPREVLAIMGGSGAGKTTLMNILAFQSSKEVESKGAVLVNGKAMTKLDMRRMSAYVQQIDLFCGTLTVKEQLTYSALLRMGDKYTYKEKMEKVKEVIKDMNLTDCQDTLIGVPNRRKGISILTDPTILFCDEPTTGLDGFMAHQVVQALQLMAGKGKTVVCVIHQPGSTIFNMFDSLGHQSLRVPESHNPADHVIAKLAVNNDTIEKDVKRVKFITEMFEESYAADELKELIRTTSIKPEEDDEDDQEKHN
ncbi:ABC transporter, ATP-binding protein, partial [Teladorsagia circumcincta]